MAIFRRGIPSVRRCGGRGPGGGAVGLRGLRGLDLGIDQTSFSMMCRLLFSPVLFSFFLKCRKNRRGEREGLDREK